MKGFPLAGALSVLGFSLKAAYGSVIGIDYGSQYLKASYPSSRGHDPLPIVFNKISDRSTPNVVSFRGDKALLGPEADKPFLNQPERAYNWLSRLIGTQFDSPEVQELLSTSVASWEKEPTRGTFLVTAEKQEKVPVEYLGAALLSKMVEWAEAQSSRGIKDVVIAIPPFLNQAQRNAMIDTATMAGLNVLSLVHDISAAAIFYGAFSMGKASEGRYVVIFDSGATHSAASLVYIEPNHTEDTTTATLIDVKRTVWDMELCGFALDKAVASLLEKKYGEPVPKGKSLNRLLVEANRVKGKLTVNALIHTFLDELVGEKSLSTRLSRDEFEASVPHLHEKASSIINDLLTAAGLSIADIHSIIPIGGNSRVPFVQKDLGKKFGNKVQYVLNMEEAIAQGTAFYAATLSHFRVKPIRFRDVYSQTIDLHYGNQQKVVIYPSFSQLEGHKGIAFEKTDSLDGIIRSSEQEEIMSIHVSGMQTALAKVADRALVSSKLKFWVDLTASGTVAIKEAPVALVKYEELVADTKVTKTPDQAAANETQVEPQAETPKLVKQQKTVSLPLEYSVKALFPHMTSEEVTSWAAKIQAAKELEMHLALRSEQRNHVESKLYELVGLMDAKKYEPFAQVEELNRFHAWIKSARDLLEEPEEAHTIDDYKNFLADVLVLEEKIQTRSREHSCRKPTAEKLTKAIEDTLAYVEGLRRDFPDPATRAQTEEDLALLESTAKDALSWYQDLAEQQDRLTKADDPVLRCVSMETRLRDLQRRHLTTAMKRLPEIKPFTNATADESVANGNANAAFNATQYEPDSPSVQRDEQDKVDASSVVGEDQVPEDKMEL